MADRLVAASDGIDLAQSQLLKATTICVIFMVAEVIGGYLAGSLAIMTDAAHLLSDVAGFVVSLLCLSLTKRKPTALLSFGFKRAEVLGALLSVSLIWVVTGLLIVEAAERTTMILEKNKRYEPVNGKLMFWVAVLGLVCNLIILSVLGHSHAHGGIGGGHGHSHDDRGHDHGHSHDDHGHDHGHSHGSHGHSHQNEAQGLLHDDEHFPSHANDDDLHSSHGEHEKLLSENGKSDISTPPPFEEEHEMNGLSIRYSFVSGDYGTMDSPNINGSAPTTHQSKQNLNVQAAYIHAVGDLLQSAGVIIAGAIIWAFPHDIYPMAQLSDPMATFLFSILVLYSTFQVLKTSINVLMEGVPAGLDPGKIKRAIERLPGVLECHDLHIWSLSIGHPFLSVHVVLKQQANNEIVLQRVHELLYSRFHITHSTVQVETDTHYSSGKFTKNTGCHAYDGDDV